MEEIEKCKRFNQQVDRREIPCPHSRSHTHGHLQYWSCMTCGQGGKFGAECCHLWQYYEAYGCVVCCNCSRKDRSRTSPFA
jgi:hypothetical protein